MIEGRQLVDHHHVEVEGEAAVVDQPLDVLSVDDIDVGLRLKGSLPLSLGSHGYGEGQVREVVPFSNLRRPCISRHPERSDHQHLVDHEAVEQQVRDGCQGDARFPKAHVQ